VKAKQFKQRRGRGVGRKTRGMDIRPLIDVLELREVADGQAVIEFATRADEKGTMAKTREILALLGIDPHTTHIVKRETFFAEELATA
jgi:hypothetical protein